MNGGWPHETPASSDWERWLAGHGPVLLLFARQQARCEADAQDLVQEAVVECWRRRAVDAPPPLAMVFATIQRRAVDFARSEDRRAGRELGANLDAPQCWFDSGVEERDRARLLQEARHLRADNTGAWLMVAASALAVGLAAQPAAGQEQRTVAVQSMVVGDDEGQPAKETAAQQKRIVIETIEPESGKQGAKEVAWLGVSTDETTDALALQLGLNSGEGLVVTYVAADSPAAKAGLQKYDVLVEFGDQLLVHPAQLRKLVQMHRRATRSNWASIGPAKSSRSPPRSARPRVVGDPRSKMACSPGSLEELQRRLGDLKLGENMTEQMKAIREALAKAGVDKDKIRFEVERSVEEARKAVREALRHTQKALRPATKDLEDMAEGGVEVRKGATVVVKKDRKSVKTMVKSDNSGTYVIVAAPTRHLTVHDSDGKLIFDGPIETQPQREKVPKEVWVKVKPMLREMGTIKEEEAEKEQGAE